mgnify:CR=1 FL=1
MAKPCWVLISFVIVSGLCFVSSGYSPADQSTAVLPMTKGTFWIYSATVAWQQAGEGSKTHSAVLRWRCDVIDYMERDSLKACLIRGDPRDLTWYEKGRDRGCYVMAALKDAFYFQQIEGRCAFPSKTSDFVLPEHGLLRFPTQIGAEFGNDPERRIRDGHYAWRVESQRYATLADIRGVDDVLARKSWRLVYRTLSDYQSADYTSGIGLTMYTYHHNGTVSDVEARLIEFRLGKP